MANGSWNGKVITLLAVAAAIVIAVYADRVLPGYFAKAPGETPALPSFPAARADDYFLGNAGAATDKTVIEFGDFECPYCASIGVAAQALVARHPEAKLVWKDCPLPNHPNALQAADAARCAGEQGKFWEFHDLLAASYDNLNLDLYTATAQGLKLDMARFAACFADGAVTARVRASLAECAGAGVTDLPWFYLNGKTFFGSNAVIGLTTALESR
jgi:protein-disulfide isomerase